MSQVRVQATAAEIRAGAKAIRRRNIEIVHAAGLGHIGGDLSAADILATLYLGVLRIDPEHPDDPERDLRTLAEGVPLGRMGKPADIAETAVFLASDASSFVTGLVVPVDGGLTVA